MRELNVNEISRLEERGCYAEDWSDIIVDDDFSAEALSNVSFYGHVEIGNLNGRVELEEGFIRQCCIRNATLRNVTIGDECLIENVRGYISNYSIGNKCYISNVGIITAQEGATYGQGKTIAVLNEGGDGNIVLYPGLTTQVAWLMTKYEAVRRLAPAQHDEVACIGNYTRIVGVKEINNTIVNESTEIQGASRISNSTIQSSDDASTFIGTDVIMENTIVAHGASVTDGAKIDNCFIGESVHIGKGFSAESSVFFANSYMDNGEGCAVFCGPFSTSHHKSTLLIGGEFSFCNAGSGTNQSNHAYKMGPIHWGTLERGSKTASGSHILWPARIGAFSMVMGKITTHPDVHKMPFSYIIAQGEKTYLVPGINIRTVGTWRDVGKWPKRDLRPRAARRDLINFAFPNPFIIQNVLEAKEILRKIEIQQGRDVNEYEYHGCYIKRSALVNATRYYDIAIGLFLWDFFSTNNADADLEQQNMVWMDLGGMLSPKVEVDSIIRDIENGSIASMSELEEILRQIHNNYKGYAQNYARFVMQHEGGSMFVDQNYWMQKAEEAHNLWLRMVKDDAEKEYGMGDVEEEALREFLNKI